MNLKKQLCLFLLGAAFFVTLGSQAFAVPASPEPSDPNSLCNSVQTSGSGISTFCDEYNSRNGGAGDPVDNASSPLTGKNSLLYKIVQLVTYFTGAASVIMIIVGGFRYVTSGGDSASTKGAKDTILYAVIGLAITIFAQTIIIFVLSKL